MLVTVSGSYSRNYFLVFKSLMLKIPSGIQNWKMRYILILLSLWNRILRYYFKISRKHSISPCNSFPYTYLLTYSMVQSPSWATNWFAASQEIPRISRNPKVHYRTHKRTPPVSIVVQSNPVHIPTSHLLQIHPNIIHPSTPRSLQRSFSLRFPHQDPVYSPLFTHTRHIPSPSHSSRFYHPHDIRWGVQII